MASLTDLTELKKRVDGLQQAHDRAVGALDQTLSQLEEKFHCSGLDEAEKLLIQYQKEEEETKQAFDKAMRVFEKEWGEE